MIIFYIAFALASIGLIIFIHEAGHFMAAKKVGCRVEAFALGFDPPIRGRKLRFFSFRRGETEYILGMIPFGGYVKLAGETLMEAGSAKPAPDELLAQSVGARALIFAAGAIMNILSAFVFFMIAFTIGVSFTQPKIGEVAPGTPAWEKGLLAGDTVVEVNGKPVKEFYEVFMTAALAGPDESVTLKVRRENDTGGAEEIVTEVTPRWNAAMGIHVIGVASALDPVLKEPPAGSVASEAGLSEGDRIVGARLGGLELPPLNSTVLINSIVSGLEEGRTVDLKVRRDANGATAEGRWVTLTPPVDSSGGVSWWKFWARPPAKIMVAPGNGTVVKALAPGSAASDHFRPGDRVLAVQGKPVGTMYWSALVDRLGGTAGNVFLDVDAADGESRRIEIDRSALLDIILGNEVLWTDHRARIGSLKKDAAGGDLREGDIITAVGDDAIYTPEQFEAVLARAASETVEVRVLRGNQVVTLPLERAALREGGAIREWRSFPPLSWVMRDGPAFRAGIEPGSRIVLVDKKEIFTWQDLVASLADVDPSTELAVAWLDPAGERKEATLRPEILVHKPVGLPIQQLKHEVSTSFLESFALGFERTLVNAKRVFLTLRSLIRREVSAKNLTGPVGITHIFTRVAEWGLGTLIYFMAIVSVNLGLLNLLPFPILDGGHLFFLLIEKIKGSPVNVRVQEWATNIAFLLIISLALFVTFQDVSRLFSF